MKGWIKLHRTFQAWGWRHKPNYVSVFLDLLLEANHSDAEYRGVKIPKGSLTTSIKAISRRTGVSEKSVRTVLAGLKRTNEVAIHPTPHYTMISIIKWDEYQSMGEPMGKQLANVGQTTGKQLATNKNVRMQEYKKPKIESGIDPMDELFEKHGIKAERKEA